MQIVVSSHTRLVGLFTLQSFLIIILKYLAFFNHSHTYRNLANIRLNQMMSSEMVLGQAIQKAILQLLPLV